MNRTQSPASSSAPPLPGGSVSPAEGATPDEVAPREADPQDARAALLLPAQLLQPGEVIVLLLKPSPLFIVLGPLKQLTVVVFVAAMLGTVLAYLGQPHWASRCVLGGLVIVAARVFWECLEWFNRTYVLTDRRVIRVAGVLRVSVFQAELSKVQHTDVLLSLRERLFNLGTIGFATAGTAALEAAWHMVANPLEVHRTVVQTIRRYGRKQ